jgi:hypothetical protein
MTMSLCKVAALIACFMSPCALAQSAQPDSLNRDDESASRSDRQVEVTARSNGREHRHTGRVLVEAADGGLLIQSNDGQLWMLDGNDIVRRKDLDKLFEPISHEKLSERLLAELPAGFRTHVTPHYVVAYDTSRAYAQWTSSLLERLYKAFINHWENEKFELREPEFPLPVLVFADRATYDQFSREDLPGGVGNIVGYYSLRTNGVNMFDLTGAEALRGDNRRRGSMREINQMLSQPQAIPLVATIVHEATHQIAFNCGMQQRYADIPLWLCEGMAVYFEAPDLSSTRGWRGIGRVNYPRLTTFRRNLGNWHSRSLSELLADSRRFRDPRTAADAYADAWALNYYLIKYEPKAYTSYLNMLAAKRPLEEDDPQTRLTEFRDHFGDLMELEQRFLKQMSRLK